MSDCRQKCTPSHVPWTKIDLWTVLTVARPRCPLRSTKGSRLTSKASASATRTTAPPSSPREERAFTLPVIAHHRLPARRAPREAKAVGGLLRCETLRAASERGAADTLLAARSTRRPRHRNRGKERESEAPPIVGTQPTCGGKASPTGRPGRAGQPTKLGEGSPPRILPARCTRGSLNYG